MPVQKVYLLNQNTPVIIPSGLVPKGAYNGATDYAVGDTVDYLGSSYVMHVDAAAGTLPTDTTKWQVLAEKGDKGDTGATGAAGVVQAVTDGAGIDVDSTDPASPIVSLDPASIASLALADSAIQSLSDLSITSTAAELNYTDGVTSAIQTQLDGKSATSHTHTAADTTDFDTEVSNNTDVAANTAARHTHANSAVLDATTASFTTADETKLDGIAAGAQVNTVTSVNTRTGAVTGLAEASDLTAHTGNTSNPHSVTKAQVGLGNADNTSDVSKPISTATQTALDGKFTQRTITGTTNQVTVTNGDGVSGNPTLSLPQNIHTGATPTFDATTIYRNTADATKAFVINQNHASATGMILDAQFGGVTRLSVTTGGVVTAYAGLIGNTITPAGTAQPVVGLNRPATNTLGFSTASTLRVSIDASGNLAPATDSTYTLGTSSLYWSNTYTDRLYLNATAYLDGGTAGTANLTGALGIQSASFSPLTLRRSSDNANGQGFRYVKSRGTIASPTGVLANDQIARFMAAGYIDDNTLPVVDPSEDFLTVVATENFTATARGRTLSLKTIKTGENVSEDRIVLNGSGNIGMKGIVYPATDSTYTLGTSSLYWSNTYTDRLYLNSTAYLDGATAGQFNIVATNLAINGSAGATGSFTTVDGKTVTVTKGLITAIV